MNIEKIRWNHFIHTVGYPLMCFVGKRRDAHFTIKLDSPEP